MNGDLKEYVPPHATSFSLVPKSLDEAIKFAEIMANSDLAPPGMRGKPGNVLVAVQMGMELDIGPMQAIQGIAVINMRASAFGDLGKALLLRSPEIEGIEITDTDEVRKTGIARCTIKRRNHPPVTRSFSIEDAKTAGLWGKPGPWTNYPYRQMGWRAFWFAARDAAADLLRGLNGREEVEDYQTVARPDAQTEIQAPRRKSEAVNRVEQVFQEAAPAVAAPVSDTPTVDAMKASAAPSNTTPLGNGTVAQTGPWKEILAKFDGKCLVCGGVMPKGQPMLYQAKVGGKHIDCQPPAANEASDDVDVG